MHKPSYGVVTGVVIVLTCIGFTSHYLVDLIPPGPPNPHNELISERAEFLQQTAHEQIAWQPLSEQAFADASKEEKPIMLVVGSACSTYGRAADKFVFSSHDVRGYLDRNFICARVDTMAQPEFQNAFLPLSRASVRPDGTRLGIPPDYQVWFLDPKGDVISYAAETVRGQPLDPTAFLSVLSDASDEYDKIQDGKAVSGDLQKSDLERIDAPPASTLPDLSQFGTYLSSAVSEDNGGFPVNGFQRLWPLAWEFQLMSGSYSDYLRSIEPCLASPEVDLLDGGFFTDATTMDWHGIGYDKLAVTNAAMMQTLALGAVLTHDPEQERIALATFDWLINSRANDGMIPAGQIGDEDTVGRSPRCSFSPRVLRDLFPSDVDREWVRNAFGLRVETEPQMTPMLASPTLISGNPKRFAAALEKMRANRPAPRFAGYAQLDVGGYAAARMLRVARILGDKKRSAEAEGLFDKLDDFRSLDDVVHSRAPEARSHAYLGDYLAYADGALQYFLATGNSAVLWNGVAVLRRGLLLYGGPVKGVYGLSEPPKKLAPQDTAVPEIVDNVRESCTAQVIRLCNDYGRLLGDRGEDLRTVAGDTFFRFAPLAAGLGQYASGYYSAALGMETSTYAVATGPNAVELASQLARRVPFSLVAPAVGPVRPPGKEPGLYIVHADSVQGPIKLDSATAALERPES